MSLYRRELIRRALLFVLLAGISLLVFTNFSPEFKSLHINNFGDNLCQFM